MKSFIIGYVSSDRMTEREWCTDDMFVAVGVGVLLGFVATVLLEHFFDFIV